MSVFTSLKEERQNFFLTPSATVRGGIYGGFLIGLIGIIVGLVTEYKARMWGAFLFNLFFFFCIALGGVVFGAIQDVIGAQWARTIRRIHEGFAAFLPVAFVLFAIFMVAILIPQSGAHGVYSWIQDPKLLDAFWGKKTWLEPHFMVARDLIGLAVICTLAFIQMRWGIERDRLFVAGNFDAAMKLGEENRQKARFWSGPFLVAYALIFTMLGVDLIKSLAPTWVSTLWGGWCFAVMMHTLLASLLLVMFGLKNSSIGAYVNRSHFHDVGKMLHGFTVFFAYLTYAHVLTYWYGNMPEETEFFLLRIHQPWIYITAIAPFFVFVIPLYTLIFKAAKWTPAVAIPICIMVLLSQWFIALLIVMPQVVAASSWKFPWIELMILCGFAALFVQTFYAFAKRNPMLAVADPILEKALSGDHH